MAIEMSFSKEEQTKESIIDLVYNIIDSKIQYLNYQTKGIARPLNLDKSLDVSVQGEAISDSLSFDEVEKIFLQFEVQSKQKKHLLYFRRLLDTTNATIALALLSDNILFEFSEQEIAYIMDTQTKQRAA